MDDERHTRWAAAEEDDDWTAPEPGPILVMTTVALLAWGAAGMLLAPLVAASKRCLYACFGDSWIEEDRQ